MLFSRHAFSYPAYSTACGQVTSVQVDWTYGAAGTSTSINPAWTETAKYAECGLNSRVRHEDLTGLSFEDNLFDLVITQDVFEHIPDYKKSFSEIHRVLKPTGKLVFTIPFFSDQETTRIRASLGESGIIHHFPAEIHGNPVSTEGSLCYQNFGWGILERPTQSRIHDCTGEYVLEAMARPPGLFILCFLGI